MSKYSLVEYRIKAVGSSYIHTQFEKKFKKLYRQLLEPIGQQFDEFEYYKFSKHIRGEDLSDGEQKEKGGV